MNLLQQRADGLELKLEYSVKEKTKLTMPAMWTLIGLELKNNNSNYHWHFGKKI